MKAKDLTQSQRLAVRCQTCGARPGKPCELPSGEPRNESHRARKYSAVDAVMRQRAVLKETGLLSQPWCSA